MHLNAVEDVHQSLREGDVRDVEDGYGTKHCPLEKVAEILLVPEHDKRPKQTEEKDGCCWYEDVHQRCNN